MKAKRSTDDRTIRGALRCGNPNCKSLPRSAYVPANIYHEEPDGGFTVERTFLLGKGDVALVRTELDMTPLDFTRLGQGNPNRLCNVCDALNALQLMIDKAELTIASGDLPAIQRYLNRIKFPS